MAQTIAGLHCRKAADAQYDTRFRESHLGRSIQPSLGIMDSRRELAGLHVLTQSE